MTSKDIDASARFVSMDTHPANCSLVITFEVPIVATEPKTGRELPQGNKRDQFQINIPAIDNLTKNDLEGTSGAAPFDSRQLSEEIISQFPILSGAGDLAKILEDILLNVQYLFNRKRAQLYQPATNKPSRPPSSTGSGRLASARAGSARARTSVKNDTATKINENHPMDIYNRLCAKHLERVSGRSNHSDIQTLDEFELQINNHLEETELEFKVNQVAESRLENLESQLEDLYGDQEERTRSMATIRRFIQQSEEQLASASSNRLLVCAMLRILRDCDGTRDHYLSKSILYCLIKFTNIRDSAWHRMAPGETDSSGGDAGERSELIRVVLDLLEKQTVWLNRCDDLRQIVPFYTNSLLVLLTNLIQEKVSENNHRKLIVLQYGNALAQILVGILEALAKHVARYLRAPNEHYERLVLTLRLTLTIILQLVIFKEFVHLLRISSARAQSLVNSSVSLINTLQLCRPGSGTQQQHHMLISDSATLVDIYELELNLLKLITILTYDTGLKARLVRKNLLLKCVLRNLVVFLAASRKSNSLSPFDRSPVLMIPFKCLYELSCSDKIKHELFKSKIVMKCLLEYLLSAATDLTAELKGAGGHRPRGQTGLNLHEDDQIVLEPQNASHYILSFWLNLSARNMAPIYHLTEGHEELREPICDYLQLVAGHLLTFMNLVESQNSSATLQPTRALHMSVYVNAKLLRNLSQFLEPVGLNETVLRSISHSCHLMLAQIQAGRCQEFAPLTVESLAALANLVCGHPATKASSNDKYDSRLYLELILEQLFGERGLFAAWGLAELEGEYDDLLLVSINLLGALARNREICAELKSIHRGLLNVVNAILGQKQTDIETLTSCLFTLRQLMNHSSFLQELGQSLDRQQDDTQQQQQQQQTLALVMVQGLSLLIMNPDVSVAKLANSILNMLKQFEGLYSLSESIACQRRFAAYNSKWLDAIRSSRDDPRDNILEVQPEGAAMHIQLEDEEEEEEADRRREDYNQLRTIHEIESQSTSSSRLSTSSSFGKNLKRQNVNGAKNHEDDDDDEDDDDELDEADNAGMGEEEEEEETFSEPDLNVIDANSMIKHLTNRREFRAELLRR